MDLSALQLQDSADKGAELKLRHPVTEEELFDDAGAPMFLRLVGHDSTRFRNATRDQQLRHKGKNRVSPEAADRGVIEILTACTLGFHVQVGGETPKFSEAEARKLYTEYSWIREQAAEFVYERSNFFPTPLRG